MSNEYDGDFEWLPVDYNPGLTVEDWLILLQDEKVFTPSSINVITGMKNLGGVATCAELSQAYGQKPVFYNTAVWQLGRRVHKKTGCPLYLVKNYKYWTIPCLGRNAGLARAGGFEWKLRDELSVALDALEEEKRGKEARTMALSSLLEIAKRYESEHPRSEETIVRRIHRNPYISEYAKRRAKGYCQLCGNPAPFSDSDGKPYLETHHIMWLSRGGSDTLDNVAALCPNCHRKMHIVQSQADIDKLKESALVLSGEEKAKADSSTS